MISHWKSCIRSATEQVKSCLTSGSKEGMWLDNTHQSHLDLRPMAGRLSVVMHKQDTTGLFFFLFYARQLKANKTNKANNRNVWYKLHNTESALVWLFKWMKTFFISSLGPATERKFGQSWKMKSKLLCKQKKTSLRLQVSQHDVWPSRNPQ